MASPVILVPGYGGSRLEARLFRSANESDRYGYFCPSTSDWMTIWVNIKLLLPFFIDCLIDIMKLRYDYSTNTTIDMPGVEVRVKRSSNSTLDSVEYFADSMQFSFSGYFAQVIDLLINQLGYIREKSLRGAPYDFRKAPNELHDLMDELKTMTEQLFITNKNQPISFICHSMGCNNMLHFLQRQPKNWKKYYVKRLISLAAPWAGSVSALRATAIGHDFGAPFLFNQSQLLTVQRSLPSTVYLLPHPIEFSNDSLIIANLKNWDQVTNLSDISAIISANPNLTTFGAYNYGQFFDAIKHPAGYMMYQGTKDLLGSLEPPEVELWCLVGTGYPTLSQISYEGQFPNSKSTDHFADGDGTVELRAASYCKKWQTEQSEPVHYFEFRHSHIGMLREKKVLNFIKGILVRHSKPSDSQPNSGDSITSVNYNLGVSDLFGFRRFIGPYQ